MLTKCALRYKLASKANESSPGSRAQQVGDGQNLKHLSMYRLMQQIQGKHGQNPYAANPCKSARAFTRLMQYLPQSCPQPLTARQISTPCSRGQGQGTDTLTQSAGGSVPREIAYKATTVVTTIPTLERHPSASRTHLNKDQPQLLEIRFLPVIHDGGPLPLS